MLLANKGVVIGVVKLGAQGCRRAEGLGGCRVAPILNFLGFRVRDLDYFNLVARCLVLRDVGLIGVLFIAIYREGNVFVVRGLKLKQILLFRTEVCDGRVGSGGALIVRGGRRRHKHGLNHHLEAFVRTPGAALLVAACEALSDLGLIPTVRLVVRYVADEGRTLRHEDVVGLVRVDCRVGGLHITRTACGAFLVVAVDVLDVGCRDLDVLVGIGQGVVGREVAVVILAIELPDAIDVVIAGVRVVGRKLAEGVYQPVALVVAREGIVLAGKDVLMAGIARVRIFRLDIDVTAVGHEFRALNNVPAQATILFEVRVFLRVNLGANQKQRDVVVHDARPLLLHGQVRHARVGEHCALVLELTVVCAVLSGVPNLLILGAYLLVVGAEGIDRGGINRVVVGAGVFRRVRIRLVLQGP